MKKPIDDLDDLPEMTDDFLHEIQEPKFVEVQPISVEVKEVKKVDKDWWMKEYGPKPPGPGLYAMDALIVFLFCAMFWLTISVWIWTFN